MKDATTAIGASELPAAALAQPQPAARAWARLLRPRQWIKNFFILAPPIFSRRAMDPESQVRAVTAFAVFCLLASGVYLFNDVIDQDSDRAHPTKRYRPIAAGTIS